jgi:hypothetical protein
MSKRSFRSALSLYDKRQKAICIDTVRNPSKGMFLGGVTYAEAVDTLREKFGYTERQIKQLETE